MLAPRRSGLDSAAAKDCWIGFIGPSATPITARASSSTPKLAARPETIEQSEKTTMAQTRNSLRWPSRSTTAPPNRPARPQQMANRAEMLAIWPSVSLRSFCTKGPRKLMALRSKKTMPKLRLNKTISRVS